MAWQIDTSHSHISFTVRHMMISKVRGSFEKFSGEINFDQQNPANSTVYAEIDLSSINTRDEKRDGHLRSADFFHIDEYPTMTFQGTRVEQTSPNTGKLYGDLTIRGISKPVVLDVEYSGIQKSPWGAEQAGFSATTTLNRKEWDLNWNVALETGGWLVGDTIKVEIELELIKVPETEPAAAELVAA
jgi:polyisoprenoid-binding protein YceI